MVRVPKSRRLARLWIQFGTVISLSHSKLQFSTSNFFSYPHLHQTPLQLQLWENYVILSLPLTAGKNTAGDPPVSRLDSPVQVARGCRNHRIFHAQLSISASGLWKSQNPVLSFLKKNGSRFWLNINCTPGPKCKCFALESRTLLRKVWLQPTKVAWRDKYPEIQCTWLF